MSTCFSILTCIYCIKKIWSDMLLLFLLINQWLSLFNRCFCFMSLLLERSCLWSVGHEIFCINYVNMVGADVVARSLHCETMNIQQLQQSPRQILTLLLLEMEYSGFWGSISCLLMPWLLKSPEHQQAWYWLCRTDNRYCCAGVDFIYLDRNEIEDVI